MKYIYEYIAIGAIALGWSLTSMAQAPSDAYRNIQEGVVGTARTKAMGGAAGALGADAGAVYINPAGAGLFTRTTLGLGMDLGRGNTSLASKDMTITRSLAVAGLNNVSYFSRGYAIPVPGSNYLRVSYGFATGQEYNYKRDYEMGVNNPRFSLTDLMVAKANSIGLGFDSYRTTKTQDPFLTGVNPLVAMGVSGEIVALGKKVDPTTDKEYTFFEAPFYSKEHGPMPLRSNHLNVSERGSRYYTDFNLAFNLNDTYFFGTALRIGSMSYSRNSALKEDFIDPAEWDDPINSHLNYATSLDVSSTSIAANLGFMMAIGDYGRIGISYLTPQYAQYKELYSGAVKSRLNSVKEVDKRDFTFESGEYRSDYGMITPGKLTVSAMAFLSKYGMVTYDFQYRNLGASKLLLGNSAMVNGATDYIKQDYGSELSHRVGLEVRPLNWLSLRAGYAHIGSPLKTEQFKHEPEDGLDYEYPASGMIADFTLPRSYQAITGGLGFSIGRSTTIDLAYVHEIRKEKVYPFSGWTDPRDPENSFIAVKGGDLKETRGSLVANLTIRF